MIAIATDEFFTGAVGVFVGLLLLSLAVEAPGVEPVFWEKRQAINISKGRRTW